MSILFIYTLLMFTDPLAPYQWENRILLIFGSEEMVAAQLDIWNKQQKGMDDRDLVVFIIATTYSKNPEGKLLSRQDEQYLKKQFHDDREPYQAILIGKDGGEKLNTNSLLQTDRLFATIDAMPMRKREMKDDGGQ